MVQNVYEYILEGMKLDIFNTSQRQYLTQRVNHVCFKREQYIDMDKTTSLLSFISKTCTHNVTYKFVTCDLKGYYT